VITLVALVVALLFLSPPWSYAVVAGAAIVDVAESGVFLWWSRRRRRRTTAAVGVESLVGRVGTVTTPLAPDGQVRVNGELWAARSTHRVERGARVVVRAVNGLVLLVEAAEGTTS
jgi:membrane protein implicated in regulation of membrane protease activity